jgi:hypothetical protein
MHNIIGWSNHTQPELLSAVELAERWPSLPAFTWTRHPLERLISGYEEILHRAAPDTKAYKQEKLRLEHTSSARIAGGVSFLAMPPGRERFHIFLQNLVAGAPIFEVEHVYAGSAVLALAGQRRLLTVHRLERGNFSADVSAMRERCGGATADIEWNASLSTHSVRKLCN